MSSKCFQCTGYVYPWDKNDQNFYCKHHSLELFKHKNGSDWWCGKVSDTLNRFEKKGNLVSDKWSQKIYADTS